MIIGVALDVNLAPGRIVRRGAHKVGEGESVSADEAKILLSRPSWAREITADEAKRYRSPNPGNFIMPPVPAETTGQPEKPSEPEETNEIVDQLAQEVEGLSPEELQAYWDAKSDDQLKSILVDGFGEEPKSWSKGQMENMIEKRLKDAD